MITPIKALTIGQICERKDDLLVSNDDIHKLAKHVKEQAIDEFAERMKAKLVLKYGNATATEQYVAMQATDWCNEVAEQMKGEQNG